MQKWKLDSPFIMKEDQLKNKMIWQLTEDNKFWKLFFKGHSYFNAGYFLLYLQVDANTRPI